MIIAAADTLAEYVTDEQIQKGQIYPDLENIRDISAAIAARVMETAFSEVTRSYR